MIHPYHTGELKSSARTNNQTIIDAVLRVSYQWLIKQYTQFFHFIFWYQTPQATTAIQNFTLVSGQMFSSLCTAALWISGSLDGSASQSCHRQNGPLLKSFMNKKVRNPPGQKVGSKHELEMWLKAEPGRGSTQQIPHPTPLILQRFLGRYLAFC